MISNYFVFDIFPFFLFFKKNTLYNYIQNSTNDKTNLFRKEVKTPRTYVVNDIRFVNCAFRTTLFQVRNRTPINVHACKIGLPMESG